MKKKSTAKSVTRTKKIFFVLVFLGLMTGAISHSPAAPGDVNNNGVVDITDAMFIARFYVGLEPAEFITEAADVNVDGNIDIFDALLVAQYYVGLIKALSPPLEDIFDIQEFSSREWYGGVMGSGGGTDFSGCLTILVTGLEKIPGIWVDNRYYLPTITQITSPGSTTYTEGDEIEITFAYRWIPDMPEIGIEPREDPPLEKGPPFTGAALIICEVNGEEKGYIVDVITELEPVYYP